MHIAVDLDDCVLDFCGGVREAVQTEYGVDIPPFDRWELDNILDPIIGRPWRDWLAERDWLWSHFPAVPGAIGTLSALRAAGHYLECVTSKPRWAEFAVWRWLGKWRPPFNRVTIVDSSTPKHAVTDAIVLVDDNIDNCDGWAASMADKYPHIRTAILFDRPHNQAVRVRPHERVHRARNWSGVADLVAKFSEGQKDG